MSAQHDDLVASAEREAAEAEALADALEERIRSGDDQVSAEELSTAKGLIGFAKLRVEAGRRKAEKHRKAVVSDRVTAAIGQSRDVVAGQPDLEQLADQAVTALCDYLVAAKDFHTLALAAAGELANAESEAKDFGVPGPRAVARCAGGSDMSVVTAKGDYHHINLLRLRRERALKDVVDQVTKALK